MLRLVLIVVLGFPVGASAAGTILVLGDSLSTGYGLPREAGWTHLLSARLAREHPDYRVVNASISGETTLGGRNRIGALLEKHTPAIVIVELGGNDGLRGTPLESIRANLEAIVRASQAGRARVLLLGMRLPPNYGASYTRRFEAQFAEVSKQLGTALVPFFLEGFGERAELFQADAIHPTREAQPIMLETVWNVLAPMLVRRVR